MSLLSHLLGGDRWIPFIRCLSSALSVARKRCPGRRGLERSRGWARQRQSPPSVRDTRETRVLGVWCERVSAP